MCAYLGNSVITVLSGGGGSGDGAVFNDGKNVPQRRSSKKVVLVFIAAGQQGGVRAGELFNHFKCSSGSGSGCLQADKQNDVAKLPLASGPFPVGLNNHNNNDNNNLQAALVRTANSKTAGVDADSVVSQGEVVDLAHSNAAGATVSNHRPLLEKNAVPLTSAKEEQAARDFGYLQAESLEARVIVGSAITVESTREKTVASNKRITEYVTNVPPNMIIVYHYHKKRSPLVLPRIPDDTVSFSHVV
ncbi:uncharacterized protein LOC111249606 isoform X1 [Varroa destructor]|uniref:Uncharacterized protein n=1 Tax=Varroa destructor TaxID=109461 RepID=A0A7M7K283_VARDE|nr:uncharacterized protein LOC111249606 isoform X1 [Varroa destructor]